MDDELREWLATIFAPLNQGAAVHAFPPPGALSRTLAPLVPNTAPFERNVSPATATQFATAGVDVWLRSVHSFLVSTAITTTSPIWASVTGYYSSHYAVRALAHLVGCFQLFQRKRIVRLRLEGGRFVCSFLTKSGGDREHKVYWKVVKGSAAFRGNDLFTENDPAAAESDVRHRNHANYADHLMQYPTFRPLDADATRDRIEYISKIRFDAAPIPRFVQFPDVEYVQLIAYHRLIAFRSLLDEALGGKNRFWTVHRSPAFASDFMDFQLLQREAGLLSS